MATNNKETNGDLLRYVLDVTLKGKYVSGIDWSTKVLEFLPPEKLKEIFDFSITNEGEANQLEIKDLIDFVTRYSVKTQHPHFYNQLYGGIDEVGLATAWLTETMNTNQHTYEVAPVFILVENFILKYLIKYIGWEFGEGVFVPGGSISNMYGIALARHNYYPKLKDTGMFGQKPLVILTSDMSHYSVQKTASWMGFGAHNVVAVKSDDNGKLTIDNLKAAIDKVRSEGREPFCIVATCGTTIFGAFDPVASISSLCKTENLWLHVDACWGGGVIFSSKHKHLMAGIESANSVSWNPHKMLCVPLQCSVFLVQHETLLTDYNKIGATYLFQQDKHYNVAYDTGDKSLQCGRKPDAFKLWSALKIHGLAKIALRVEKGFHAACYLRKLISKRNDFRLVIQDQDCTNVCFWYIPPSLQGLEETESWWKKLHNVAPKIKERMVLKGSLMIGYQPMESKKKVNFFRLIVHGVDSQSEDDMTFIINEIESLGKDL